MKNIVYQLFILFAFSLSAQRLETVVQTGHTRPVKAIAISNNGKLFASSGRDKSIVLWDAQTHKQIKSFIGHEASILGLRFSPNDSLLASVSSDQTVKLWDINSSEIIYEYLDKDYLLNVAFHPKDNLIAIGGYPFTFKIIDYKTKTVIREISCDPDIGTGGGVDLEFSPSGDLLFTGEDNKVARIFETRNYEQIQKYENLYGSCGGCATQVAYDEKNKKLYKLSKYDSLKVYSTTDNKLLLAFGNKVNEIGGIQISNDGTKVYASYNDTLFIYNANSGAEIKFFDLKKNGIEKVSSLVVNESDSTFYVASGDTYIKGISLLTGNIGKSFFGINNFKDKGGLDYNEDSYWDSYIGRCMYFKNYFMMLDHDKSFVTGKLGKDAIVWDLYSGEPVNYYGGNSKAVVCFDKWIEKNQIVYGDADGAISVWDNLNNKLIKKIEVHREPVFSVCFNKAQNQIITTSWDASIGIFDATTFAKIKYIDLKNSSAFSLKPVKNGLYLAMGKLDKTFVLMEPDTKEIVLEFKGHTDVVSSIEENTKTGELLTASWDGTTRIWNISSGLMTLRVKTPGTIHSAIYHHDYSKFYTAGSDGIIRIWDAKTGKLITKLIGHKAEITQLHLSEDGQNLFSLSTDGTLKNWDLQKGEELYEHIRISAKDWMVKSPTGFFNATYGARDMICFVKGLEVYKADQFFNRYYRPDLLEKIFKHKLRLGNIDQDIERVYKGDVKLVLTPMPDGKTASLSIRIPQANIKLLEEIKLSHNGKKLPLVIEHEGDSTKGRGIYKTVKVMVNLVSGLNVFTVLPISKNKIEAKTTEVRYYAENASFETNCHLFVIGINDYANPNLNLRYARADAEAFSASFVDQAAQLYKNLHVHTFYDQNATKRNIMDSLKAMSKQVALHDIFVFYYAGHGSMANEMFYLIPQNCSRLFDSDKLASQAISAKDLQVAFKDIKALKQVVILDACQSGGSLNTLASRGANEEKAIAQLSRSTGVHIFASAGSEQSAKESEVLKHGIFTYVLLNALNGDADGSPKDQKVTIYELKSFLDDQVPEVNQKYSGKVQYPYTFSVGQDFPLVFLKKD